MINRCICLAIPLVSKRIFRRFVLGSWLLAVTVISIWVSCIFKSDAYEVGYLKINDLDDWLKHSTTPLVIVRNSDAFRYFNAWVIKPRNVLEMQRLQKYKRILE